MIKEGSALATEFTSVETMRDCTIVMRALDLRVK